MDMAEIEKRYLEKIAKICLEFSYKIDDILIREYKYIIKHKRIEIHQDDIGYNYLADRYKKEVLKALQQHYIKNWNIVHYEDLVRNKEKQGRFIFTYKEIQGIQGIQESQTDRYSLIDL